ncbi:aminopeptidase N-like [Bacillus rossius redtenbacheri]|uniref:aminopeptidase N-like n=1 Tax=Bacillus rossius redtenbacheri TaxID=93214 RepID=UPI002FDE3604
MDALSATRLVLVALVTSLPGSLGDRPVHRLPGTAVPSHYRISMDTRFQEDNFTFHGEEWIDFHVLEMTSNLTLHSKGLHIVEDEVTVSSLSPGMNYSAGVLGSELFNTTAVEASRDLLTVSLDDSLMPGGTYRLHLRFSGRLSSSLTGYYRQSYMDQEANTTRWLASTTFEPSEARRAFPCWDEPGLRARFQVSLARSADHSALSNMPLASSEPMEGRQGWVWDHFEESPPMPTYLVAFYVGSLRGGDPAPGPGTPLRVWARPEVVPRTALATRMGADLLRALASLAAVDNPLPKQDVLALPAFVTDALENWGLISFQEKYLLHQPGISSTSIQEKSAFVMAHELAHNWFGNLVGIKWWSDIWLSEGFATYYAALVVDRVRPEWDQHTMFAGKALIRVLSLDAQRNSHPLTLGVTRSEELQKIFDSITYLKGYYVLRMLSHALGEGTFQRGTTRYLKVHMFGTAGQEDLWSHLDSQAREDGVVLPANATVGQIMAPWSLRAGYPVLAVLRDYDNDTATVSQERFLDEGSGARSGGGKVRPSSRQGWWVPVTSTTRGALGFNDTRPVGWLRPSDTHITLQQLPADEWVLLNVRAAGLYRVQYDERNWRLLARHLDSDQFRDVHVLNRVQLLDDALDLARAGQLAYPVALELLAYLLREDHVLPWKAAFDNLSYLYRMLGGTETGPAFEGFVLRLVTGRYEELGFRTKAGESPQARELRKQLRWWACTLGHEGCARSALELLDSWVREPHPDDRNPIAAELRATTYCTAAERGGPRRWQFLWERLQGTGSRTDGASLLQGLACSRDPASLRRLLDWSLDRSPRMRQQDSAAVFRAVVKTEVGADVGRQFLQQRLDDVVQAVGLNPFYVPTLLDALSAGLKQPEHIKELEELAGRQSWRSNSARQSVRHAVERARSNTQWLSHNLQPISSWLQERAPGAPSPAL